MVSRYELQELGGRPVLLTARLKLRPFSSEDAKKVQLLAGHERVAATTALIPHPYPDGVAEEWIASHESWFRDQRGVHFGIELLGNSELIGCIDLSVSVANKKAELAYWVGFDFWNHGFCTEAAKAVVRFGFENLGLQKITSRHMSINPSSGRVMQKIGMKREGHLRREYFKNGKMHDMEVYGILKEELGD
jgi:ribosomal-protein-alanine N-acetyltransferase